MQENIKSHLKSLNERQLEAVLHQKGPILILAGAGAGKTKTITHRILNLIHDGVNPKEILAITFTNKAAKEMRDRVESLISQNNDLNRPISIDEKPFVSTFHSLGVHIIKENAKHLGLTRHFGIFDRSDSKGAVKDALKELDLDPKQFEPGKILNAISREKGDFITQEEYSHGADKDFWTKIVSRVWELYEKKLKKEKSLDFDDLLLKTAILLKNPEIRAHYQGIWKYIHVDEYQDTNKVQYQISKLLSEKSRNICVVGDIDQNIYSWRGADIQNILNFEKDYPEAKIILLEQNYRSTQNILKAANAIIKKNLIRREKNLFTKNEEGERILLLENYDENEEARAVADKIKGLLEKGIYPEEISVLYRANFQSRVLEESFMKKNVPYQLLGIRFFDRKEVKDILSYIKVSFNPESTSDLARIINVPPKGIGKATLIKIISGEISGLPSQMKAKIADFQSLLARIKQFSLENKPSETIKYVLRESGIEKMLREGGGEEQEKLENIKELASVASKYDLLTPEEGIESLLSDSALATDQDELQEKRSGVKMMTVHASKGLEFEYVFITGLEQDLFPHVKIGEENLDAGEEEEERRLFYVAITRAKKKVFLSWAQVRTIFGAQKVNSPSEFISDISPELIEREDFEKPKGVKAIFIDF